MVSREPVSLASTETLVLHAQRLLTYHGETHGAIHVYVGEDFWSLPFVQGRDPYSVLYRNTARGGLPDRPVTLPAPVPGGPGMRPPPRPMPPAMRPPPRPQFSWRGRYYNPIRGSLFRYPPGYAYRRWSIGTFLPGLFLGSSYYYDDWRMLGIDRPPPGRRWVRYGPDLLLVNLRNRRVEDVIYNVFY